MAIRALHPPAQVRWSWLRIGGVSGTLFVHTLALILLAIPVAMPSYRPAPPELSIRWIEAPPEPVVLPVPDEPVPLPRPQVDRTPVTVPVVAPDIPVESAVPEPAIPARVDSIASAEVPTSAVSAGVDNASLDYESIVKPKYPVAAIRRGEEGTVLLRVTVGRDGLPTHAEVARSSGSRYLDTEAREVVMRWRFRPVRIDGVAVRATGLIPIQFDLRQR
jgi:protein TonB